MQFSIEVPSDFDFGHTVRSYGFYAMAPNLYDKVTHTFQRPLRASAEDGTSKIVTIKITHMPPPVVKIENQSALSAYLSVQCNVELSSYEKSGIEKQIVRMLRTTADYMPQFHSLFPPAKDLGFGRMFRSPTLFEDIVKTMTNVNTTFKRTQRMNQLLCENVGTNGAFPTPQELVAFGEEQLASVCSVGYRAQRLVRFAQEVCDDQIDLQWFEDKALELQDPSLNTEAKVTIRGELKKRFLSIHGFGEFSANNLFQILGIYDIIPSDTETARLLREQYNVNLKNPKEIAACAQNIFSEYAPFQFLVYWYKLYREHMSSTTTTCFFEENVYTKPIDKPKAKREAQEEGNEENSENGAPNKKRNKKKKTDSITIAVSTPTTSQQNNPPTPISSRRRTKTNKPL